MLLQNFLDEAHDATVRVVGILATLQQTSIARLEAKREHVEGDVRTGLIDNTDYAERHTHTLQVETVWQHHMFQHAS